MADFIPDACAARAIQACLLAKQCLIGQFGIPALVGRLGKSGQLVNTLRLVLNGQAMCVLDALESAFAEAGLPFPVPPSPPDPPDVAGAIADALAAIQADIDDPAAFLAPYVNVTFDADFYPTRIQTL